MIQFDKPENLNGIELSAELADAGIELKQLPFIDGNGLLWLDVKPADKVKAATIVAAHNGNIEPQEATVADKLASVGLNIDDLKSALGL